FRCQPYSSSFLILFFFAYASTTSIYTLSLHDALPISISMYLAAGAGPPNVRDMSDARGGQRMGVTTQKDSNKKASDLVGISPWLDRKSTRLNSSHEWISYAVFCLKKKIKNQEQHSSAE